MATIAPGVDVSPLPTAVVALDGRLLLVNDPFCRLVGRTRSQLYELTETDIVHPEDADRAVRLLEGITSADAPERERRRYVRPGGEAVQAWIYASPFRDENGGPIGAVVHALERSSPPSCPPIPLSDEQSFRLVFMSHPQPMWIFDLETLRFLEVNDAACTHYGYSRREFLSLTTKDIRPPEDVPALDAFLQAVPTGLHSNGMYRHRRANGEIIEIEGTTNNLVFDGRDALLVVVRDVTDHNALERQLMAQALHHPLTGLPNRALFLDRLEQALENAAPRRLVGVLDVDLDDFHLVNETFGHEESDAILRVVAGRVTERVPSRVTVASLTGEELALCIPDLPDPPSALVFARQVQQLVEEPIARADGIELTLSACVGVATTADPSTEPIALLSEAAHGRSRAKSQGVAQVAVANDDGRPHQGRRRLLARQRLRAAIEGGEIVVHYQPVVALSSRLVVGVEALARWADRDRGLLPPAEFISLAEETGLVVPLGRVVLEQVCRDMVADIPPTTAEGRHFVVSVNLSGRHLGSGTLVPLVRRILDETNLDPRRLALEMTETALISESDDVRDELAALRELGVHLSLDDFGTGYSSLTRLDRHPFDIVKIDRSFVTGMHEDDRHRAIVAGVISLATSLGGVVVAEGVESEDEARHLEALGAGRAQGFHFHPPMPLAALCALLHAQQSTR